MLVHYYITFLFAFVLSASMAIPVAYDAAVVPREPLAEEKRQKTPPPGWKRQKGTPPSWKRQKGVARG
ncbi:hypothetical protein D9757_006984 [Collybiopsis confluens]|uniref:Uncharacterized protein n=1 Tax=Collybiopsis confluens TaxID=2823264 RepID=A0A8H5HIR1_9AGAR|nr:hypothetical protein D9757_006984 [Collybiopsis confluens]